LQEQLEVWVLKLKGFFQKIYKLNVKVNKK
jgi:hypothetical protein